MSYAWFVLFLLVAQSQLCLPPLPTQLATHTRVSCEPSLSSHSQLRPERISHCKIFHAGLVRALDAPITVMAAPRRPAYASTMGLGWPNVLTSWTLAEVCINALF
jgi:hypothetical protein